MSVDENMFAWVREALEPIGTVTMRRMMGGATLYLDGIVFAIIAYGDLWFKADSETDAAWDAIGRERFAVQMAGRTATMNYRRAPDDVHDDPGAMRLWARLAVEAGQRAAARKKPRRKKQRGGG